MADVCPGIFVVKTEICGQSAGDVILETQGDGFLACIFDLAVLPFQRPGQNAEFRAYA